MKHISWHASSPTIATIMSALAPSKETKFGWRAKNSVFVDCIFLRNFSLMSRKMNHLCRILGILGGRSCGSYVDQGDFETRCGQQYGR